MTIRIGYFPNNNSLFVLRHNGLLEPHLRDVEWVDLRELPAPPRADPRTGLPTLHSDWLFAEDGTTSSAPGSPRRSPAWGRDATWCTSGSPARASRTGDW